MIDIDITSNQLRLGATTQSKQPIFDDCHHLNLFTFGAENIQELRDDDSTDTKIKCLQLGMRDQIDCDISLYLYSTIDFIEKALKQAPAKILIHCYKVSTESTTTAIILMSLIIFCF